MTKKADDMISGLCIDVTVDTRIYSLHHGFT